MDTCMEHFVEEAESQAELVDGVSGYRRTGTLANFRYLIRGQADRLLERLAALDELNCSPQAVGTTVGQTRQLACLCLGLACYLNGSRPCPVCGGYGHRGGRPCEACQGTGVQGGGTS